MFQCACGLQPPIFPFREKEAFFHATQTFILCFIQTSSYARTLPLKALKHCFISATRRLSQATVYWVGQKVWLSIQHLPLQVESRQLAPIFTDPFPIKKIVIPVSVRLNLIRSVSIYPKFHVSKVKPVQESTMVPAAPTYLLPHLIEGGPA